MLKNLHFKFLAFVLAIVFWIFVVSLENIFVAFPTKIPVSAFNLAEGLALTSELPKVSLMLRTDTPDMVRNLSPNEFEAYIDLGKLGAGEKRVPILVTSKNPKVSVAKIQPDFVDIRLEPLKEKIVSLSLEIDGKPAPGYAVEKAELNHTTITVRGAESVMRDVVSGKALVALDGKEKENTVKKSVVRIYDELRREVTSVQVKGAENIEARLIITQVEAQKGVGVRAKLTGTLNNTFLESVTVNPVSVTIRGKRETVEKISILETEAIPVDTLPIGETTKKVKFILPAGISLAEGERDTAEVKLAVKSI